MSDTTRDEIREHREQKLRRLTLMRKLEEARLEKRDVRIACVGDRCEIIEETEEGD